MVEMSTRIWGQAMPVILQDLRKRLVEAGVETKLGFPRMVENLCWGRSGGNWGTENWASTCERLRATGSAQLA